MDNAAASLGGKRIVITRAREQSQELTEILQSLGANVILFPCVEFAPPADTQAFDSALNRLADFDWILFTSQNAVRYFSERCREIGLPARPIDSLQMYRPKVAAIGPGTARAANREGIRVDYVAKNHTGESLIEELRGSLRDCDLLVPRSDRAGERLLATLNEAGARVAAPIAYRTVKPQVCDPEILGRIRRAEVETIIFASPSAFYNFAEITGREETRALSLKLNYVAIGPTTADAMRAAGVRVASEASDATAASIAKAISGCDREMSVKSRQS